MSLKRKLLNIFNQIILIFIINISVFGLFEEQLEPIEIIHTNYIYMTRDIAEITKERVVFTSYYNTDRYSTSTITSSGLTTSDFKINSNGWYTFKGHVVIGAATNLCIKVTSGACGKFNEYKDTHHYFDLFDIVDITLLGETYSAIVLDSCGACNWDEEYQRIDIFVSNSNYNIGKVKGAIRYGN